MNIKLLRHAQNFWVAQITGDEALKELNSIHPETFWSLTKTTEELSLVSVLAEHPTFTTAEGPWVLFQVEGVLDFGLTGILNSLTKPLADAGISLFAISTFNTDYILVKSDVADDAAKAWLAAGKTIAQI